MTRFAFGAKCGSTGQAAGSGASAKASRGRASASAQGAEPGPTRPKNWRRVLAARRSRSIAGPLVLGDRLVEVQDRACRPRAGGALLGVDASVSSRGDSPTGSDSFAASRVAGQSASGVRVKVCSEHVALLRRSARARVTSRNANAHRAPRASAPPSFITRSASIARRLDEAARRSAGPAPAAACWCALGARRRPRGSARRTLIIAGGGDGPLPEGVQAAAVEVLAVVLHVVLGARAVPPTARPADTASPTARRSSRRAGR